MKVDTLLVVAGPRACGKTRFIASCRRDTALQQQAPELARFFGRAPKSIRMTQVEKHRGKTYEHAILHLDIYTPFEYAPILPGAELKAWMTVGRFAGNKAVAMIESARELYAVTLDVPREVTLRRWLDRKSQDGRRQVATNLVRILSDAADDDLLYRHLYGVWNRFIGALRPRQHWRITETANGYVIADPASRSNRPAGAMR
ncbi:MAG: hypothetical protein HYR49_05270 [Gammaproteobacteria bacterium]|nr:hypothetical protein [Gammaproteobacteria bacterium]